MAILTSALYTLIIGGVFIYLIIFVYDLFYGEKPERQIKKIHKYFRKDTVKKIDKLEHQPRKFTLYQVTTTNNGTQKIKVKPGYKVVKIIAQKNK